MNWALKIKLSRLLNTHQRARNGRGASHAANDDGGRINATLSICQYVGIITKIVIFPDRESQPALAATSGHGQS